MTATADRFAFDARTTFAAAGSVELYAPPTSGDVLNVRQLTVSTEDAAELVVYFGRTTADRLKPGYVIRGAFLGANGGAAPDLACLGRWSPSPGLPIRLYASAACDVWTTGEGRIEA